MTIDFRPLGPLGNRTLSVCLECYALVLMLQQEEHRKWHRSLTADVAAAGSTAWVEED